MAKYILSAGHTLTGSGCGAVGYISESEETRKVTNAVKRYLEGKGHTVVDATVDKASSQSAYLNVVAKIANKHPDADLFVSIHFNASGTGRGKGTECFTWKGAHTKPAVGICQELSKLGFKDRGIKNGSQLYVLRKTTMPAVLVEICFVDSFSDVQLYTRLGVNKVAQAITRGILTR